MGNPTAPAAGTGARYTRWEALDKRCVRAGREGQGSRRRLGGAARACGVVGRGPGIGGRASPAGAGNGRGLPLHLLVEDVLG